MPMPKLSTYERHTDPQAHATAQIKAPARLKGHSGRGCCVSRARSIMQNKDSKSELISRTDFGPSGFRWLTLSRIQYRDPSGRQRTWECAERKTRASGVDGVAIFALVRNMSKFRRYINPEGRLVLVTQFRPSQGAYVIEVPAGLVDKGETAEVAAERELKEETGYAGVAAQVMPVAFSDPGMTNSNMQGVVIEVDGDAEPNINVQATPEEGEYIEVFLLPLADLYDGLQRVQKEKGWEIDARLQLYAAGLQHQAKYLGSSSIPAPSLENPKPTAVSSSLDPHDHDGDSGQHNHTTGSGLASVSSAMPSATSRDPSSQQTTAPTESTKQGRATSAEADNRNAGSTKVPQEQEATSMDSLLGLGHLGRQEIWHVALAMGLGGTLVGAAAALALQRLLRA